MRSMDGYIKNGYISNGEPAKIYKKAVEPISEN